MSSSDPFVDEFGNRTWFLEGNQHMVINADGEQSWYKETRLHRDDDMPAILYANGRQVWFKDGRIHRYNGPAIVNDDGTQAWQAASRRRLACLYVYKWRSGMVQR